MRVETQGVYTALFSFLCSTVVLFFSPLPLSFLSKRGVDYMSSLLLTFSWLLIFAQFPNFFFFFEEEE